MKTVTLLLLACTLVGSWAQVLQPSPLRITAPAFGNSTKKCPSKDVLPSLCQAVQQVFNCGEGEWTEVASFDMADTSQSCPSSWTEVTSPSRLCRSSSCQNSAVFNVSRPYSRICGMVIGYATGTPDGFSGSNSIDGKYLDGVSITHGRSPRQHIWSLAAGHDSSVYGYFRCPCATDNRYYAPFPPSFVGQQYFCATTITNQNNENVWDGRSCTGSCCNFHSPPWFSASLPAPTSDGIEVRICADGLSGVDEDIYIRKLLLQVQ